MLWVPFCLFSVVLQTLRNGLQKSLAAQVPAEIVTWARFTFGLPILFLYVILLVLFGHNFPAFSSPIFWIYLLIAAPAQFFGNTLLVLLFSERNFVVGITYSKTEALLSAIFAVLFFSEEISYSGFLAVVVGMIGITLISMVGQHKSPLLLFKNLTQRAALLGIGVGLCYGLSGTLIRQAILSLEGGTLLMNAGVSLLVMASLQALLANLSIFLRFPQKLRSRSSSSPLLASLKGCFLRALLVGVTGSLASIGWFIAYSLTQVAYVLAVGQIEILLSLFLTHKVFKEPTHPSEIGGIGMVLASILLLIYVG